MSLIALDLNTGRVDTEHRYKVDVRGSPTAVVTAFSEMNRHGRICGQVINDSYKVLSDGRVAAMGQCDFIPFESWVSRGGRISELVSQLRYVTRGMGEIGVYVYLTDYGAAGVAACAALAPRDVGRTLTGAGEAASRLVGGTTEALIQTVGGVGQTVQATGQGLGAIGAALGFLGPVGGFIVIGLASFVAYKVLTR